MACGVCNPKPFRQALDLEPDARVWGYTCRHNTTFAVRALYFHGAELVLWDCPTPVPVLRRPVLARLIRLARAGDLLVIHDATDFGCRQSSQQGILGALESHDLQVAVLTDQGQELGRSS